MRLRAQKNKVCKPVFSRFTILFRISMSAVFVQRGLTGSNKCFKQLFEYFVSLLQECSDMQDTHSAEICGVRERLLQAAFEVFAEQGFKTTTYMETAFLT